MYCNRQMPTGRIHDRITLTCLPLVGGMSLWLCRSSSVTLSLCSGFLFSGLMFGPDLDIYSLQFKRWGPLKVIWLPYQKGLRHRSWLSHGPIVGTVLRLGYLGVWLGLVGGAVALLVHLVWGLPWDGVQALSWGRRVAQAYQQEGLALLVGLELGAMSHALSDGVSSAFKSARRSKRPLTPGRRNHRRRRKGCHKG